MKFKTVKQAREFWKSLDNASKLKLINSAPGICDTDWNDVIVNKPCYSYSRKFNFSDFKIGIVVSEHPKPENKGATYWLAYIGQKHRKPKLKQKCATIEEAKKVCDDYLVANGWATRKSKFV